MKTRTGYFSREQALLLWGNKLILWLWASIHIEELRGWLERRHSFSRYLSDPEEANQLIASPSPVTMSYEAWAQSPTLIIPCLTRKQSSWSIPKSQSSVTFITTLKRKYSLLCAFTWDNCTVITLLRGLRPFPKWQNRAMTYKAKGIVVLSLGPEHKGNKWSLNWKMNISQRTPEFWKSGRSKIYSSIEVKYLCLSCCLLKETNWVCLLSKLQWWLQTSGQLGLTTPDPGIQTHIKNHS